MRYLLLLLCVLEVLWATWLQNIAGPLITPLLFLLTSLGIGFVFLRVSNEEHAPAALPAMRPLLVKGLQLIPFLILSYLLFKTNKTIWWWQQTQDSGIDRSDIIPQITALVQRTLRGEQPYYPIPYPGYELFPTYLPFQWLPYMITELAHKDYRWIPVIFLWLSSLYFFIKYTSRASDTPIWLRLVLPTWPLAVWYALVLYDNDMFKLTVEALIAAYYLFAAASIDNKRTLPLAIGIAVCLLSRYSIIFWVPLCVGCYLLAGEKRKVLVISGVIAVFFILFYWLPFLRRDPAIFINGYHYHTKAAYLQWYSDLTDLGGKFYLYNGFGFTAWALRFLPGDLGYQLALYQKLHLALCTLCIAMLLYYYWKHKGRYRLSHFLLFSFKVYLAVFYAFIQIPYKYLYITPLIITSVLLTTAFGRARTKH